MSFNLVDYGELDRAAPSRSAVSGTATHVAEAPQLPDGRKRVEFYPYSSTSESYAYVYWRSVGQLTYSDVLPPSVPSYILIEGALIDLFRYKMSQAMNASNGESAAFWRNEMRTQETKWNDHLVEAIGADRGEDDTSFILKHLGAARGPTDITTARDHILAGRGVTTGRQKGGHIRIKVTEPCYIMCICSITPRIDYGQGNTWDTYLN